MRLFPLRDGEEKETLSYAEAARWLVTLIGFDDSASTKRRPELALDGSGIVLMCMQLGKTCLKR